FPRQKEITGRVTLEGSGPMPRMSILLLPVAATPGTSTPQVSSSTGATAGFAQSPATTSPSTLSINPQPDGSFTSTVPEGEYRIGSAAGLPAGYSLKSMTYG